MSEVAPTPSLNTNPDHFLWTEKYRPDFDKVIIPDELRATLRSYISNGKIPSFLFFSPSPGTGKTTTALALAKELGSSYYFINASIENNIDKIRIDVTQFATTASLFQDGMKIVILDEADRLSPAAQDGLKGLIESVSKNCAFILTCNNKAKVTDPLRSRCTEVDFIYTAEQQHALSIQMLKRMMDILKEENITYDAKALATLVKKYVPDNRKLIQICQNYALQRGSIDVGILAVAESKDVQTLIAAIKAKDFQGTLKWSMDNADSIGDDFYRVVYNNLKEFVDPQTIAQMVLTLNDYQRYHSTVPDRFLHMVAMCTHLMMEIKIK